MMTNALPIKGLTIFFTANGKNKKTILTCKYLKINSTHLSYIPTGQKWIRNRKPGFINLETFKYKFGEQDLCLHQDITTLSDN